MTWPPTARPSKRWSDLRVAGTRTTTDLDHTPTFHHQIADLTVAGVTIRTNITKADLNDPNLWTMRTPEQWAQAIATTART